jgi:hypothetical protein
MIVKKDASLKGIDEIMILMMPKIEKLYEAIGKEFVITSGTDGTHSIGSLHYKGLAVDIRLPYLTPNANKPFVEMIKLVLNIDFDVVLEKDHIHIEYDPK